MGKAGALHHLLLEVLTWWDVLLLASCVIFHHGDVLTLLRHLSAKLPKEESKNKHPLGKTWHNMPSSGAQLVCSHILLHETIMVCQPNSRSIKHPIASHQPTTANHLFSHCKKISTLFPFPDEPWNYTIVLREGHSSRYMLPTGFHTSAEILPRESNASASKSTRSMFCLQSSNRGRQQEGSANMPNWDLKGLPQPFTTLQQSCTKLSAGHSNPHLEGRKNSPMDMSQKENMDFA